MSDLPERLRRICRTCGSNILSIKEIQDATWEAADEVERLRALIEQLMQIAHSNALFNGGLGDRDPVVGFSLIMAEWDRICAENDRYETEIERLRAELATANHCSVPSSLPHWMRSHESLTTWRKDK